MNEPAMRDSLVSFVHFFDSALRDGIDKQIAMTRLMAELHAEHSRGVSDAAELCADVARMASDPAYRRAATIIAEQLRAFRERNDANHEADIHTW